MFEENFINQTSHFMAPDPEEEMKMIQHQAFKSAVPPFKSDLTVAIILGIPEYNKVGI